jgi:hypothetical protein
VLNSVEAVNQIKIKAPPKLASLSNDGGEGWGLVSTVDDRASIDASIFHVDPACTEYSFVAGIYIGSRR